MGTNSSKLILSPKEGFRMIRKTYPMILGLAGLLVLATVLAGLLPPPAALAVPQTISLQGRYTDSGGNPVSATATGAVTGNITINIFNAETGGSSLLTVGGPVIVSDVTFDSTGIFNVAVPLPESISFNMIDVWLEITVDLSRPDEGSVTLPRQRMASAPTALVAQRIQTPVTGLDAGPVVRAVIYGSGNAIYAQSLGADATL